MKKSLLIVNCSKKKLETPAKAKDLYTGQFFRGVKQLSEKLDFDLAILSAKYGLLNANQIIEPYDQIIKSKKDIQELQKKIRSKFSNLLENYNEIILFMGKKYRMVFSQYLDNPKVKFAYDHRGSGGYLQLISTLNKKRNEEILRTFNQKNSFSIDDI